MSSERRKLVLLPGMDGTGMLFKPFISSLPAPFAAHPIAFPPDRPLSYPQLALLVHAQIPASEPFVLLAESFSTPLAIQIAAARPAALRALILVAGFATNPTSAWFSRALPWLLIQRRLRLPTLVIRRYLLGPGASSALVSSVKDATGSVRQEVFASRLDSVFHCDSRPQLAQVVVPILYLQASHDRLVPPRCLSEILAIKPGTAVVRIEGPHLLLQSEPRQSVEAVRHFIEQLMGIRK